MTPYAAGQKAALQKFAALSLGNKLDLAGLGVLALPTVHSMVRGRDVPEDKATHTAKNIAELVGLGLLASGTLTNHFMKPH